MEHGTTNEITRIASQGIKRPEVKKSYNYKGGNALGMLSRKNMGVLFSFNISWQQPVPLAQLVRADGS